MIDLQFDQFMDFYGITYSLKRNKVLQRSLPKNATSNFVFLPINFDPHLLELNEALWKHHKAMLFKDSDLSEDGPKLPMVA